MIYGSVCSGIESATVAWDPLGWRPAFFSEIDPFPRAVLSHHYPVVPLHGDFTTIRDGDYAAIDVLVGGTPCQSFSVAGLRGGMADDRGNLALEYLRLADRLRSRWLVWENVPGVLSSSGGRDFGAFLGGLAKLGYGWAYRILDAQYFGLAQRRTRVFLVGNRGSWQRAAAVLLERHSLSGNPAPSRKAGEGVAPPIAGYSSGGGANGPGRTADDAETWIPTLARCVTTGEGKRRDFETTTMLVCNVADSLTVGANQTQTTGFAGDVVAFHNRQDPDISGDVTHPLGAQDNGMAVYLPGVGVRRLTPRECERLFGFPVDYTLVPYRGKPAGDYPRYKALGNSMAVPVMRWIGERIAAVDAIERVGAA